MAKNVHIALWPNLSAVRFFDLSILGLKLYIDWIGRCDDGLSNVVSPENSFDLFSSSCSIGSVTVGGLSPNPSNSP